QDPAFTISGLPQYTENGSALILINIILFSSVVTKVLWLLSFSADHMLKLVGGVVILL
ncbi:unnamed protein product, partial [Staurois parvus]